MWIEKSTDSVAASCGILEIISVVGVWTESFANWSDGEDVVGVVDWEKAWVIDWSKDGLSTELLFLSGTDILLKSHPHVSFLKSINKSKIVDLMDLEVFNTLEVET